MKSISINRKSTHILQGKMKENEIKYGVSGTSEFTLAEKGSIPAKLNPFVETETICDSGGKGSLLVVFTSLSIQFQSGNKPCTLIMRHPKYPGIFVSKLIMS
jgi:hypothetical protein